MDMRKKPLKTAIAIAAVVLGLWFGSYHFLIEYPYTWKSATEVQLLYLASMGKQDKEAGVEIKSGFQTPLTTGYGTVRQFSETIYQTAYEKTEEVLK